MEPVFPAVTPQRRGNGGVSVGSPSASLLQILIIQCKNFKSTMEDFLCYDSVRTSASCRYNRKGRKTYGISQRKHVQPDTAGFGFAPNPDTNDMFAAMGPKERAQHGQASIVYLKKEDLNRERQENL